MIQERYNDIIRKFTNLWYDSDQNLSQLKLRQYTIDEKNKTEQNFTKALDYIFNMLDNFPADSSKQKVWSKNTISYIYDLLNNVSFDKNNIIKYFIGTGFLDATREFIGRSKDYEIKIDELGQAMRNAWIMNVLQLISDIKVCCSASVFSYSMLYPFTDNFIDSNISLDAKKRFNSALEDRLKGIAVSPIDENQKNIFKMIENIEDEFDRYNHIDLFESILLIQKGQANSLIQQSIFLPYEKDIPYITFFKGGSSVLADAYLILGNISENMIDFSTLFGICLQLCDDMIDLQSDTDNTHSTIFSVSAKHNNIDKLATKALALNSICFTSYIKNFEFNNKINVLEFMKECCDYLIIIGAMMNKKYFSNEYINDIEVYSPISLKYINKAGKTIKKKFSSINKKYSESEREKMYGILLEEFLN